MSSSGATQPSPDVELPQDFIARIRRSYQDGAQWLEDLPALVEGATRRWGLTEISPVPNLSYNFVAFAKVRPSPPAPFDSPSASSGCQLRAAPLPAGEVGEVVLKIGPPNDELASEIAALRLIDGEGCCRLLDADDEHYTLLLERLRPGRMLSELADDDEATRIAAEVMRRLWREVPPRSEPGWERFIRLSDWFAPLGGLRSRYGGTTGPFPMELVERVEQVLPELFADPLPPVLMHGDFHHFNVLSSGFGWRVIDPKGVIGPRGYECGPLLINPWDDFAERPDAVGTTQRRVAILSEGLGLEPQAILDWGICHTLLSAWWDTDGTGTGGEYSIRCGEIFLNTKV
jgi:streptomycin 6-kinase